MPPSRRENRNLAQLVTGLLAILTVSSQNCRACLFHDDGIRELSITCPGYGVTLLRSNGALTGITAKGNLVSRGSLDGCLFGMVTPNNTYCGACSCADNVLLTAHDSLPYFDLTYRLIAAPTSGPGFSWLLFPSSILFDTAGITALHAPLLPGVVLGPGFFQRRTSTSWYYPGGGGFAGWTHIDAANGSLAIYDLSGPDIITPIITIPAPTTGPPYAPSEWYLAVYHPVNVTAACVPTASPSSSAQCALGANGSLARRFHVTPSSSRASALETIAAYVEHNGMLAPTSGKAHAWASPPYPTLRAKLGSAPGGGPNFWRQVYQAPLLKLDAVAVGLPYANYSSQIYRGLPVPSLIHYCAFEQGGFDSNFPDMLPPAPAFGSSCDLIDSMAAAMRKGHLTMPYFNPTWWDPFSQTLVPFSGALGAVAALNSSGGAYYATYPDVPVPKTGIATCPWSPFVRSRIATEIARLSPNATIGTGNNTLANNSSACNVSAPVLPSSFVFEDQVSALWPYNDFSPFNAGASFLGYVRGWQVHLAEYSRIGLHSEQGVDRMARAALGFHGTVLARVFDGSGDASWGTGNWAPEPLYAASGLRGLALHFQHNLDGSTMAHDVPELCWAVSLGVQLSLDLSYAHARANSSWLAVVSDIQRVLLSRFADYTVVGFGRAENTPSIATLLRTQFRGIPTTPEYSSTYEVLWNTANATSITAAVTVAGARNSSALTIPPLGCALIGGNASSMSGNDVLGGTFVELYNGASLEPGIHVIVEDRSCVLSSAGSAICIYHPWGIDTSITIALPLAWQQPSAQVFVMALNATLEPAMPVPSVTEGAFVSFLWRRRLNGSTITAYAALAILASVSSSSSGTCSISQSPTSALPTLSPPPSSSSISGVSLSSSPTDATSAASSFSVSRTPPPSSQLLTASTVFSFSQSLTPSANNLLVVVSDAADTSSSALSTAVVASAAMTTVAAVFVALAAVLYRRSHQAKTSPLKSTHQRMASEVPASIPKPLHGAVIRDGPAPELQLEISSTYLSTPIVKARSTARSYRQLSFDVAPARGSSPRHGAGASESVTNLKVASTTDSTAGPGSG